MRVERFLLILSLAGVAAALGVPGMDAGLLLAGPMAVASLILLIARLWRSPANQPGKSTDGPKGGLPGRSAFSRKDKAPGRPIVIDGSNVLHWRDETPDLGAVAEVIGALQARGFAPGVMFDANIGYKIGTRYQDDAEIARRLGLPEDRVVVVPKGVPADAYILQAARDLGARIVSNDRYRDWTKAHPEVAEPGHVMRGGFRQGQLWLSETP